MKVRILATGFGLCACILSSENRLFADGQIVSSNSVAGAAVPTADLVVTKFRGGMARVDVSPASSVLSFKGKAEQVLLYHQTKTYARQPVPPATNSSVSQSLAASQPATLEGQPAELYCWTNGLEHGCTWVAPASQFISSGVGPSRVLMESGPSLQSAVGLPFGSSSIVVATEYATMVPMPVSSPVASGTNGPPLTVTNVPLTIRSRLLSITETNLSDAEFEIPPGYRDATGEPSPLLQPPPPELFGQKFAEAYNAVRARREFGKGQPLLLSPLLDQSKRLPAEPKPSDPAPSISR